MKLVLLPGLDGTGQLFEPFVTEAPDSWSTQVIRYPPDRVMDYEGYGGLARAALPMLESYVLLGESFSGPIAISLASENPPGLRGLVLCNTFARHPWWSAFAALPWTVVLSHPGWSMVGRWLGIPAEDHHLQGLFRSAVGAVEPRVLARRVRQILTVDMTTSLQAVEVPILCLRGSRDSVVPRRALTHIQGTRPDASVTEILAPHLLLQVTPGAAWDAIGEFAAHGGAG